MSKSRQPAATGVQVDAMATSASPAGSTYSPVKPRGGMVLGIGTDITECERIERMLDKHGEVFLARVYTPGEIGYCTGRKAAVQHYAGRWAAKEAVLKALGTGWAHGIQWTDVEVVNQQGGKPSIELTGKALEISAQMGIREIMISISHCQNYAVAYATAIAGE